MILLFGSLELLFSKENSISSFTDFIQFLAISSLSVACFLCFYLRVQPEGVNDQSFVLSRQVILFCVLPSLNLYPY